MSDHRRALQIRPDRHIDGQVVAALPFQLDKLEKLPTPGVAETHEPEEEDPWEAFTARVEFYALAFCLVCATALTAIALVLYGHVALVYLGLAS